MDISIYLNAVDVSKIETAPWSKDSLGSSTVFYKDESDLKGIMDFDIVIVGAMEDRGNPDNEGSNIAPDEIRKHLYQLTFPGRRTKMIDLGNVFPGDQVSDTYYALKHVVSALGKRQLTVVVLGGTQDLTYSVYQGYEDLEQMVNVVSVDSRLDLGLMEDPLTSKNYLSKIVLHQPNYLFNYSNVGYQTYFSGQEELAVLQRLNFDAYRVGYVRDNIEEVEAIVRNADIVSVDISAVKYSDAPGNKTPSVNGFYGEEICRIARYAGVGDKVSCFGIFDVNPIVDQVTITSQLASQIVWYFIEGFYSRVNDYPVVSLDKYTKYNVTFDSQDHVVVFYKSDKSERWWMEVPFPQGKDEKYSRHHIMPCSYQDYLTACEGEVPNRWWQTYNKLY